MNEVYKGSTSHSAFFELVDSTTGLPKVGIAAASVTADYARTRSAAVAITPSALTNLTDAFAAGGWKEKGGGVYRFDVTDAAFATGADEVVVTVAATGCRTVSRAFTLVDWNKQVASIPNAQAGANTGLPVVGTQIPNAAANATGGLYTLGGTGVNVAQFGGAAGTFSGGRPEVNATHAAGTAWNSGAIGSSTFATDAITATTLASNASTEIAIAVRDISNGSPAGSSLGAAINSAYVAADNANTNASTAALGINDIKGAGWVTGDNLHARLDAAGVRAAVGLASANLDTQLSAVDTDVQTAIDVASGTLNAVAAVKADTANLLTRIPAALFAGITSLAKWLGAIAGKTADTATRTEINATTAGATYNETTDSQEATRDRGDAAWTTGAGGGGGGNTINVNVDITETEVGAS
jgi:hypothetical protein